MHPKHRATSVDAKMLFIGLDSAEPDLLMEWSQQGLLPNFTTLLNQSAWSRVCAPPGFGAGALWPTLYTGMNIGNHGRYFFEQIQPGSYQVMRISEDESVKSPPLWKILSDQGCRVCVIDGDRAPLAQGLNGKQIVDWAAHDPTGETRSWPREYSQRIIEDFGPDPLGSHCDTFTGSDTRYLDLRDRLKMRIQHKTAMALSQLAEESWDFFMVNFADPHDIGHMCWHLHDCNHFLHQKEFARQHGDPVLDIYQEIDAAIGRILQATPENYHVILFAGPGMEPAYTGNYILTPVLRRLQGHPSVGASSSRAKLSAFYKKNIPFAVRRALEFYVKTKKTGKTEQQRRDSRYFQIPHNQNSGAIRINLVGREPHGKVLPGNEYNETCESLKEDLMALVDMETGKRVVREVIRVDEPFHGKYMEYLPDLMVVWERQSLIQAVNSPRTGAIYKQYGGSRTGDHSSRCMFMASGPGIIRGELADSIRVESIAPTLADLLGCRLDNTDGTSFTNTMTL